MNAVEIEQAISDLCAAEFDAVEFPFQFLEAFGEKATTIKRLRPGKNSTNKSDLTGGLLQRNNIHLLVSATGQVNADLQRLTSSPTLEKSDKPSASTMQTTQKLDKQDTTKLKPYSKSTN